MPVPFISEFLAYLHKEGRIVKDAPLTFVVAIVLGAVAGLAYAKHDDASHLQSVSDLLESEKQGRANEKSLLEQRIASKDDLLTDYRSKLLIADQRASNVPVAGAAAPRVEDKQRQLYTAATRFSRASNPQLRSMGIKLAQEIREIADNAILSYSAPMQLSASEMLIKNHQYMSEYENKYEADAIVIRDELLSRLPLLQRPDYVNSEYEHPTNPLGLKEVASDLDTLARRLP